jgi:hypothetical protein
MAREMLKGSCENMTQLGLAGDGPRQKKKSASPPSKRRVNGPYKRGALPEKKIVQVEQSPPPASVSRMERTRRLFLAALRVWELRRRIRD